MNVLFAPAHWDGAQNSNLEIRILMSEIIKSDLAIEAGG